MNGCARSGLLTNSLGGWNVDKVDRGVALVQVVTIPRDVLLPASSHAADLFPYCRGRVNDEQHL